MKVFIGWLGEASRLVAQALREWLCNIIQAIKPWMSEEDINKGAQWNSELANNLEETSVVCFGDVCVLGTFMQNVLNGGNARSARTSRIGDMPCSASVLACSPWQGGVKKKADEGARPAGRERQRQRWGEGERAARLANQEATRCWTACSCPL
jgi:hypothetical protein